MGKAKFFWNLLKGNRMRYSIIIILGILKSGFQVFEAYLTKSIIDDVITGQQYEKLIGILIMLMICIIVHMLIWYYNRYGLDTVGQYITLDMRQRGYKKMMSLDFKFFDKNRTGDIMTQLTADINYIRHFFAYVLYTLIEQSAIFISAIAVMLSMCEISLIILMIIVLPLITVLSIRLVKQIHPCFKEIREMRSQLNTVVQENISANRVVKAFGREDFENKKMEAFNDAFKYAQFKANKIDRKYSPWLANAGTVFFIYNVVVGGILVINGSMTMGSILMFNSMIWMLTAPLSMFGGLFNETANCIASSEKLIDFLNTEPEIVNDVKIKKPTIEGNFEFKHVVFDYRNEGALRDVSFKVKKGEKVAIVGATGSGKSTIINLISRFYEAKSGQVLVDGVDVKDMDVEVLRGSIAVAQQDVFLFSETISNNIAYGNATATIEEITEAAKLADAEEFISELPDGYDTIVGERGMGLSGGQKQRLTLARALLKKPSVLVLDDTTSALDANTEKYIQNQLDTYFKDKTVFIISQRISSVKDCDQIIVLEHGCITEIGKHEQLIKNGGYYSSVYEHQYGEMANSEVKSNG